MVKIIKLDPKKNPELIKEIDGLLSDILNFFGDDFLSPLFEQKEEAPKQKEEPKLSMDWITLGDLIDNWSKHNMKKEDNVNNICPKVKTQIQTPKPEYDDVRTIEHIV